jgi:hypothetical protein
VANETASTRETAPTRQTALAQVLIAFGSALGTLYVSHAAAKFGFHRFGDVVEKNLDHWDENVPQLMEYARTIARTTAANAIARGASTISLEDLMKGLMSVEQGDRGHDYIPGCPFFHEHRA